MGEEFGHSLAGSPAQASQAVIQASEEAAVRLGGSLPPSIKLPEDSGPWDYMMEAHVCLPAVSQGQLSIPRDPTLLCKQLTHGCLLCGHGLF